MGGVVTIFRDGKNITEPNYITINQALSRIKSGKSKEIVESIRNGKAKGEDVRSLKLSLPSVVFAGKCTDFVKKKKRNGTLWSY